MIEEINEQNNKINNVIQKSNRNTQLFKKSKEMTSRKN